MGRLGWHHVPRKGRVSEFNLDIQKDPHSFKWEILREDDLSTRDYEEELLVLCKNDPLCYNKRWRNGSKLSNVRTPFEDGPKWDADTKKKIGDSVKAAHTPELAQKQSDAASRLNSTKKTCPHCGLTTNPGNLAQHIKHGRCKVQG
jgi:hypothetical protein